MKKLNILIVEDEVLIAELIGVYVRESGHEVTDIAISFDEVIRSYYLKKPDLILLDIRLYGQKSGIDIADFLNEKGENTPIIYLSSQYDQKTLATALQTNPYGFLTKPVTRETLWTSIEAAYALFLAKHQPEQEKTLEVFDGRHHHSIRVQDIIYMEADHVYVNIKLITGRVINIRSTLKQMAEMAEDQRLVQCHRSFVINRDQVISWNAETVIMSDQSVIPVSRGKRKDVFGT